MSDISNFLKQKQQSTYFHSTFNNFEEFDFSKSPFGIHFGTQESAENRIFVKINEHERLGCPLPKNGCEPIMIEAKLNFSNPLFLKENRCGAWSPFDVLREIIQQAENEGIDGINDHDIEEFYDDETSLNGIQLMSLMDEEEYDGAFKQDYMEQLFIRNWIESKGYDAIVYDNEFEGGGQSLIILRPEQIQIVNKVQLKIQPEEEQSTKIKSSIKI